MIQNLMFDLGGVIMDIERARCVKAFLELGMPDPNQFLGEYSQAGPFGALEAGQITPDEFHKEIRKYIPGIVTDRQIDAAFIQFLIGIPVHRLRQLQLLRQKYNLYLLSNTNTIMWDAFILPDFQKDGLDIDGYFDGVCTSFEAKCLKPNAGIFDYARDKFGIKPDETVFLDDSRANADASTKLGFQGLYVPAGDEFWNVLKQNGLVEDNA